MDPRSVIPPPPPGFTLDTPEQRPGGIPPPPPGFTLDPPASIARPRPVPPPPPGFTLDAPAPRAAPPPPAPTSYTPGLFTASENPWGDITRPRAGPAPRENLDSLARAAAARLRLSDEDLAAQMSGQPDTLTGANLLMQRDRDRVVMDRWQRQQGTQPAELPPITAPVPMGEFAAAAAPDRLATPAPYQAPVIPGPGARLDAPADDLGLPGVGEHTRPAPVLRHDPSLGDEIATGAKGFAAGASAGLYEPDPDLQTGSDIAALGGRLAGAVLGTIGAGVATAGVGAPAALGPATFMATQFLTDLKSRGVPVEELAQPEILTLAAVSGLVNAIIPLSVGARTGTRLATAAGLGAGQNLAEEEIIAAISRTDPQRLEAALLGGTMAGTLAMSGPMLQAVRRRIGDEALERVEAAAATAARATGRGARHAVNAVRDAAGREPLRDVPPAWMNDDVRARMRPPQEGIPYDPIAARAHDSRVGPPAPPRTAQQVAQPAQETAQGAPQPAPQPVPPEVVVSKMETEGAPAPANTANADALRAAGYSDAQIDALAQIPAFGRIIRGETVGGLAPEVRTQAPPAPPAPPAPAPPPRTPPAPDDGAATLTREAETLRYVSAADYLDRALSTAPTGVKPRRRAFYVHPDDLRALGLEGTEVSGRKYKATDARQTYGVPIVVTKHAPRLDRIAARFNEELGLGGIRTDGLDDGRTRVWDAGEVDPQYGYHSDDLIAALRDRARRPVDRRRDFQTYKESERDRMTGSRDAQRMLDEAEHYESLPPDEQAAWMGEIQARNAEAARAGEGRAQLDEIYFQGAPAFTAGVPDGKLSQANVVAAAAKAWREKGTESPFFKRWFGGSKVVDAAGKPLVVYHGTRSDFNRFRTAGGSDDDQGAFFTTNAHHAKAYTLPRRDGGNIMPVYLSMRNPYEVTHADWTSARGISPGEARRRGHDGYMIRGQSDGDTYIAFDPTQIKSATGNRGTFSSRSPSVLYQRTAPQAAPDGARGSFHVEKLPEGARRGVITLFSGRADFSTFVHEAGHYLRQAALTGADRRALENWLIARGDMTDSRRWSRQAEETFARALERHLWDGGTEAKGLARILDKVKAWLREVYTEVRGGALDIDIPPEIRAVYDRVLGLEAEASPGRNTDAGRPADERGGALATEPDFDAPLPETLFQGGDGAAQTLLKYWPRSHPRHGALKVGFIRTGGVTATVVRLADALGVRLAGYMQGVRNTELRHLWKEHADPEVEAARGQVALTERDIARIPEIQREPDRIEIAGENREGRRGLRFVKAYDDGVYHYLAMIDEPNKRLLMGTMYKKRPEGGVRSRGEIMPATGGPANRTSTGEPVTSPTRQTDLPNPDSRREVGPSTADPNISSEPSENNRLFQSDVDPEDEAFLRRLQREGAGEDLDAPDAAADREPLRGDAFRARGRESMAAADKRRQEALERLSPEENRARIDELSRPSISRDDAKGEQVSGFLTPAEQFYTDYFNEAQPLVKVQKLGEAELRRPLTPQESIEFAIDRKLGSGGSANLHITRNLFPILRGGEVQGVKYAALSPADVRHLDAYAQATDVLWRLDNVEGFEGGMMTRGAAQEIVERHRALPPATRIRVETAHRGLLAYAKDLARKAVAARVWSPEEFDVIARNPFYLPLLRDWKKVRNTPDGARGGRGAFTSTDKLTRGHYDPGLEAPWKDPLTALVSETHRFAGEIAKMGVWNRVIDLVEKAPGLEQWVKRVPQGMSKQDAEDRAGTTGGVVSVLRPRRIQLEDGDRKIADEYDKARKNIEEAKDLDAARRDEGRYRVYTEKLRDKLTRGTTKLSQREQAAVSAALTKVENDRRIWLEKRGVRDAAVVKKFEALPAEQRNRIEDWLKEGQPTHYIVPRELAEVVNGMTPPEFDGFAGVMAKSASLFRQMQVGWNPAFTGANLPRDIQEAYFTVGMKPWIAFKGLYHYLREDEVYQDYLRYGGAMEGDESGFRRAGDRADDLRYKNRYAKFKDAATWQERKVTAKGEKLTPRTLARLAYGASIPVRVAGDVASAIGEAGEMMTRLGIFDMAVNQKNLSRQEAVRLARQGTLDFKRIGRKMRKANALIPFLNARVQGVDRMARAFRDDPVAATVRAMIVAAAPTAVLLAWNHENPHYAEIPSWEKEYYWIIMKDRESGAYWKIAKGHLAQMVGNPVQMMFENWLGTGKVGGWDIAAELITGVSPIQDATGFLPPLAQEVVEQAVNFDTYFKRSIVRDAGLPAGYQASRGTSETLRALGEALSVLPEGPYRSPERIEHAIRGLLGGTGQNILFVLDEALGKTGVLPDRKLKLEYVPLLNRFHGQAREWKSDFERERRVLEMRQRELRGGFDAGAVKRFGRQYGYAVDEGESEEYLQRLEGYLGRGLEAVQQLEEDIQRRLEELEAE